MPRLAFGKIDGWETNPRNDEDQGNGWPFTRQGSEVRGRRARATSVGVPRARRSAAPQTWRGALATAGESDFWRWPAEPVGHPGEKLPGEPAQRQSGAEEREQPSHQSHQRQRTRGLG
jgi:hypothetical protein